MLRIVKDIEERMPDECMSAEDDLSIDDVNDVLANCGIQPAGFRALAWELVCQDISSDLPKVFAPRVIELKRRLDFLFAKLLEEGVEHEILKFAVDAMFSSSVNEEHKIRSPENHRNL